jgi:Uma2 family endonuclease
MNPTTTLLTSVEEYLSTSYTPDVDYLDGHLEERNVGTKAHGKMIRHIANLLDDRGLAAFIETRLRINATRFRVPDVCAYPTEPDEEVFTNPPLLCVEVLSPDDRLNSVVAQTKEYLGMGVPVVWVIDPIGRQAFTVAPTTGFYENTEGSLSAGEVHLRLDEIFGSQGQ